ncbi:MAG: ferritin family protein [Nitrospinota bacterium]|nr:ferritin family protein [Nitrospinota bacterium]
MTAEQIINTAIYNEQLAQEHYTALSGVLQKGGNEAAAQFFAEQGKREKGHFNSLMKYKERLYPQSHVSVGETVKWITAEINAESGTQAGLADALIVVEMAEKTAEKFYRDALAKATDPEARELFEKLANDEARHFQIMGRIRAMLESKGKIEPEDFADLGMD